MAEDTDKVDEAGKSLAEKWLNTVQTAPALHWANITLGAGLMGTNRVTGVRRFVKSSPLGKGNTNAIFTMGIGGIVASIVGSVTGDPTSITVMKRAANIINAVADELKDPNIEGIPIHAEAESTSRDVEVNKQIVITQSSAQKDVIVDNAVPQLRTWSIRGYLVAPPEGLDPYLIIKPSLIIQRKLLDWYASSRKPVWFKTHDNEFHKVLITHVDTAYDTRALNALLVNVSLTEFKVMEVGATSAAAIGAKLKGLFGR